VRPAIHQTAFVEEDLPLLGGPGDRHARVPSWAFTLIELLVVVAIVALLAGLLLPSLARAKSLAREKVCGSNLRQVFLALGMYAEDQEGLFPLELTEHNPHPQLLSTLEAFQPGLAQVLYCPQAHFSEPYARSPNYTPRGGVDSVIDTSENRQAGNISYVYFSFQTNKFSPGPPGGYWRETGNFFPRQITSFGVVWFDPARAAPDAPPNERWVMTDFFRQGAPFPHGRSHARGIEIVYLDGHVELMKGRPRQNYR